MARVAQESIQMQLILTLSFMLFDFQYNTKNTNLAYWHFAEIISQTINFNDLVP